MRSPRTFGKFQQALALAIVSLVGIVAVVGIVELLSAAVLKRGFSASKVLWASADSVAERPAAFGNADDYEEVRRMFAGLTNCPTNRIIYDPALGFPRFDLQDVSCDGPETVKRGLRLTLNQETNPRANIYVLGGSTVWGSGSSDRYTIPSLLQASDVVRKGRYAVWNYGFATVVASQQLRKLKSIPLKSDDVVIFYDGGNDAWQGVVYGRPEGTVIGYNESNAFEAWRNRVKFFLSRHSSFYELLHYVRFRQLGGQATNCRVLEPDTVRARAARGFDVYFASLLAAKHYSEQHGARFVHFYQPTLVSSHPFPPYVNDLISRMGMEQKCGLAPLEIGSRYYRERYAAVKDSINGTDLSQILNGSGDTAYFFDWIHVSSVGNRRIAEEMQKTLASFLDAAPAPTASSTPR